MSDNIRQAEALAVAAQWLEKWGDADFPLHHELAKLILGQRTEERNESCKTISQKCGLCESISALREIDRNLTSEELDNLKYRKHRQG